MAKPSRTFEGDEGKKSLGANGPAQIAQDIDMLTAMFDPKATLPDGSPGGIRGENVFSVLGISALPTSAKLGDLAIVKDPNGDGSNQITWYAHNGSSWVAATASVVDHAAQLNRRAIDVKDLGAKADGVADDTAAIHAARDAAGVGGTVYFPAGTYLTTTLSLNVGNQHWQLAPGATIKLKDGANSNLVEIRANGVHISGGTLDGNRAGQTAPFFSMGVVSIALCNDVTLERCTIKEAKEKVVYATKAERLRINRCCISGSDLEGIYGHGQLPNAQITFNRIELVSNDAITIHAHDGVDLTQSSPNCEIIGNQISYAGMDLTGGSNILAIELWGGEGCPHSVIADNIIKGPDLGTGRVFGISIDSSDRVVVANNRLSRNIGLALECAGGEYCQFIGNNVLDCSIGVSVSQSASKDTLIIGNVIDTCTTYGLQSLTAHRLVIEGNKFIDFANRGVFLNSGGAQSLITGNQFLIRDSSVDLTSIYLLNVDDCLVSHNYCGPDADGSSTKGVYFLRIDGSSRNIISHNRAVGLAPDQATVAASDCMTIFGGGACEFNLFDSNVGQQYGGNLISGTSAIGGINHFVNNRGINAGGVSVRATDYVHENVNFA